jgi:hypothetical protein
MKGKRKKAVSLEQMRHEPDNHVAQEQVRTET